MLVIHPWYSIKSNADVVIDVSFVVLINLCDKCGGFIVIFMKQLDDM